MNVSDEDSPTDVSTDLPPGVLPRDVLNLGYWAYREIWLHPRETIRQIVDVNPEYHVNLLIALSGIAEALDRATSIERGDVSLGIILASALVLGPGVALIGAWIYAHLIRITGDWMGGRGVYTEIKAAIGWSSVPTAVGLALWVPLLVMFGEEAFTEEGPALEGKAVEAVTYVGLTLGLTALNLWSIVLLCNCIAEVQEYQSAWKGLGNIILSGLVVIVPLAALVGVLAFLARG